MNMHIFVSYKFILPIQYREGACGGEARGRRGSAEAVRRHIRQGRRGHQKSGTILCYITAILLTECYI